MHKDLSKISHDLGIKNDIKGDEINIVLESFPYFEVFHFIFLKYLKNKGDISYPLYLRRAIVHIKDRSILYDSLNSELEEENEIIVDNTQKSVKKEKNEDKSKKNIMIIDDVIEKINKLAKKRKDKLENDFDGYSDEWDDISYSEDFSSIGDKGDLLMTETLALVYLKQNKFEKAIKAYKILCCKYPNKRDKFKDKIKYIKEKIK